VGFCFFIGGSEVIEQFSQKHEITATGADIIPK
jgi:hypothetical protein